MEAIPIRLKAIAASRMGWRPASRLEVIASRFEAIAIRLKAMAGSRLGWGPASRLEVIASRLEAS